MYPSISINDPKFKSKLVSTFKKNGVAVINDVFTNKECKTYMNSILNDFIKLNSDIDKNNIEGTWTTYNLPPQTRPGLFQTLVSNFQAVWVS